MQKCGVVAGYTSSMLISSPQPPTTVAVHNGRLVRHLRFSVSVIFCGPHYSTNLVLESRILDLHCILSVAQGVSGTNSGACGPFLQRNVGPVRCDISSVRKVITNEY